MTSTGAHLRRSYLLAATLGCVLLLLFALALCIGPVRISFGELLQGRLSELQLTALLELRLPRALLACIAGAALALSGALMQTYFRNPLAEPYITGVSAGGALGAVLGELIGLQGQYAQALCALLGAGLITAALYAFALRGQRPAPTATLLLGIALGTFCGALVWFMLLLQGPGGAQAAMAWLLGRVSTVGYGDVLALLPAVALGALLAWLYRRDLDALLLGDEKAASLGVNLSAARRGILAAAVLLAAACVAFCGVIAFVGLMVPHVLRSVAGSLHSRLLPLSALGGAVLLLLTDFGARTLHPPGEIPLTVLTSLIGAPFFILVLLRSKNISALGCLLLLSAALTLPAAAWAQDDDIDLDAEPAAGDATSVGSAADAAADIDLGSGDVDAQRDLAAILDPGSAVTVVDGAQLESAPDLASVLESVPGLDIRSDGGRGQLAVAQIRGSRAQQVLVLIDGQPLSPGQVSDLGSLPLGLLERVEVARGPEAARFGSGALGGVINLVTRRSEKTRPQRSAKGHCCPTPHPPELALSAGSHGALRAELSSEDKDLSLYLSHQQADNDYRFERGPGQTDFRRNNDSRLDTLWSRWDAGATSFGAGVRLLERGVPGSAEFPTLHARLQREGLWAQAAQTDWRAEFALEHSRYSDPQPYLGQSQDQSDTRLSAAWNWGGFAQQPGADWSVRPRLDYVDSRQFGQHQRAGLDLQRAWQCRLGAWREDFELGLVSSSDVGVDPSGRLSLSRKVEHGINVYGTLGYSVRHPDFSELYLSGAAVQGNPELDPERLASSELGLRLSGADAQFSLAAFYSEYQDSILFLPISGYAVRATNTGRTTVAGSEALLDWRVHYNGKSAALPLTRRECWLRTAWTWLPVAEFASGTPLAGRAEQHVNARLEYSAIDGAEALSTPASRYGRGWSGAFTVDYSSSMPADLFGNLVIEPRTLCGLELSRSFGQRQLCLSLSNIFDVQTRDSWNYPLPGREINLTLRSTL